MTEESRTTLVLTHKWHRKANNVSNSDMGFSHFEIKTHTHTQENVLNLVSGQEDLNWTFCFSYKQWSCLSLKYHVWMVAHSGIARPQNFNSLMRASEQFLVVLPCLVKKYNQLCQHIRKTPNSKNDLEKEEQSQKNQAP